jgi:hypothetical protein
MSTRRNRRGGGWVTSNPPRNDEYWRETKTHNVPNNYRPNNKSSEYWRETKTHNVPNNYRPNHKSNDDWRKKPEESKFKKLFKGIASGKTKKNAFGRGPNAQIASRIRNNAIHEAAKRR